MFQEVGGLYGVSERGGVRWSMFQEVENMMRIAVNPTGIALIV